MSQYDSIWNALKRDKVVSLTANRLFHARIIKATKKRKWLDMGYRMELLEDGCIAVLTHSISASVITFTLVIKKHHLDFRTRGPLTLGDM